ncbi:DUF6300 family protein [Nonomuraea sp. NPDC050202]|uniref:DUF6300 family protein n=1 Tax=Nonomuraea sp. NPDC050202 TaxID=3155035 RepID=UPI0033C5C74D
MNNQPRVNMRTVESDELPACSRCGQRVTMLVDMSRWGRGLAELCRTCDQNRPARAAWLNLLASGKLADADQLTEADMDQAKQLWAACLIDVLSAGPLGLPLQGPPSGKDAGL